jgi:hypothetical protein
MGLAAEKGQSKDASQSATQKKDRKATRTEARRIREKK